jgi:hypothetical protein
MSAAILRGTYPSKIVDHGSPPQQQHSPHDAAVYCVCVAFSRLREEKRAESISFAW